MRTQGPASRGPLAYVLLNPRVRMLAAQMMMKLCDLGAALHALRFHSFGGHYRDAGIPSEPFAKHAFRLAGM